MSFQVGDKVVCNCPGNWEKIIDEQILTVVPNDKGLTFEGQEGKICLKFLEDWPKDFSLVEEENEAKSMKIRITTSEFSYMGLHYGAVIENAVLEFPPHVPARVEFKHKGRNWCLSSESYEIVSDEAHAAILNLDLKCFDSSINTRKDGKNKMELVETGFPNALLMLGEVMTWAGDNKGYSPNDWKDIPDALNAFLGAASRHRLKRLTGIEEDEESGLPHLAHEAFNVLAQLELLLTGKLK